MPDPTVWTIEPSGSDGILEGYGYATDLLRAYTNDEQRVTQRSVPLEWLEFGLVAEGRDAQLAAALVFGNQAQVVALPLWHYGSRLTGSVGIGATLLPTADALDCPYRVGGLAVVWQTPHVWELFTVAGTSGAGVATSDTAASAWAAGAAAVFPARLARLPARTSLTRESSRVLTGRLRFTMEQT